MSARALAAEARSPVLRRRVPRAGSRLMADGRVPKHSSDCADSSTGGGAATALFTFGEPQSAEPEGPSGAGSGTTPPDGPPQRSPFRHADDAAPQKAPW